MIERDGRNLEDIRKVIIFAQTNKFWQVNILSTQKLRDKFDILMTQMLTAKRQTGGQYNANNQRNKPQQAKQSNFQPGTPDW
ncbi:phage protein [Brochothrix campestris FSL F6-1037]|nr:phage protein [Brochothrix campestris FSL F6-1037]